jgi:F-type H+-transporting ATPase subunit b
LTALALSISVPAAARAQEPETPAGHEEGAEHGQHEEEEHESPFNWAYGFLGEKDGEEPSLAYRPKGMAPPFLANIFNAALLFTLIGVLGKKPIQEGLKKRKERIVHGMQEAGKMKDDAAVRLAEYEEKLKHLDDEIERIKREMRDAAEIERRHILTEAKERRDRMERDAKLLVEQELKAARESLVKETVAAAMRSAEQLVAKELAQADHDRLAKDYLDGLRQKPQAPGARS